MLVWFTNVNARCETQRAMSFGLTNGIQVLPVKAHEQRNIDPV